MQTIRTLLAAALLAFAFQVSAEPLETLEAVVTSPETFAVCKAVDIASTSYLLTHGLGVEANPVVAPLIAHGYVPLIALSVGLYYLLKWHNSPVVTGVANVATCGVAVHNLLLIP